MESVLAVYIADHSILNPYSRGSSTADVDFPSIFSFLLVRLFRYVLRLPRISHRVWQYLSVLFSKPVQHTSWLAAISSSITTAFLAVFCYAMKTVVQPFEVGVPDPKKRETKPVQRPSSTSHLLDRQQLFAREETNSIRTSTSTTTTRIDLRRYKLF